MAALRKILANPVRLDFVAQHFSKADGHIMHNIGAL